MKILKAHSSLLTLLALPVLVTQLARADYQSTVLANNPKAYYRLNDGTSRTLINKNSGSLGAAGDATNDLVAAGNVHPFTGAIVGDGNRSEFFDFTTRTEIPFNAALNPPNTEPFTIEAWLYPASDQTGNGQSPLANRWTLVSPRQGWVFFQRKPNSDYFGGEPVGWNCRMYNGIGTSGRLDVTSLVPYQVGKWQHVVVVYDPVQVTNATLTIYIDGVAANTNIWASETDPGYVPVTSNLSPQPAMSLGNYNNANSSLNPWYGAVDEFAWYSNKLSPAQILAHYQNATNANRAQSYDSLIKSHNPVEYLRLDEIAPGPDVAVNLGDLRASGIATHTAEVRHPATGALVGRSDSGAAAYHLRNGKSTTTIPWLAANNGLDPSNTATNHAGIPFTLEAWLRPMKDQQQGQCPMNNRMVGGSGRTGWVIFQRNPNHSYPVSEGFGWELRMYYGTSSSGDDTRTEVDYTIGQWGHVVWTWEPQVENGDLNSNGNDQWVGTCTAYFNGVPVHTNDNVRYSANRQVPEASPNSGLPADLSVGSYNAASVLGNNPFEGDAGEVAIYNNYVLTPEQILAHYQAGTNANYGTNYETLVMTAGFTGPERVGLPSTYLRLNDPARYPAVNSGTLGAAADGNLSLTTNTGPGPLPSAYAGFDISNVALPLDGGKQWASLNNPAGLNFAGQITLEAWVKPDAVQTNDPARILSHGPQTLSNFIGVGYDNSVTNSQEVFLWTEGPNGGPYFYTVGSASFVDGSGTTFSQTSFAAPGADFGGGNWVHLVGTYDGAKWNLYRNGVKVASTVTAPGALSVDIGDWAIGSTGNGWANNFAGKVDEVAIYNTALTPAQVATHYVIGKAGTTALTITPAGAGSVTITWPAGTTLQQSSLVTGTYTNTPGSPVSPLTIPASGTKFYRWTLP